MTYTALVATLDTLPTTLGRESNSHFSSYLSCLRDNIASLTCFATVGTLDYFFADLFITTIMMNIYFNFMAISTVSFGSYLTASCAPFSRSPVQFLLPSCISSSWLPSPGCSWRECSSTSCWWRFLRVNIHVGNTFTWSAMGCLPSLWLCQLQ